MADQGRLHLTANGTPLRFRSHTAEGLLLENDGADLFGRAFEVRFTPLDADARDRFLEDMAGDVVTMTPHIRDGELVLDCDRALPPLVYQARFRMQGIRIPGPQSLIVDSQMTDWPIDFAIPRVRLTPDAFADADIRRLVTSRDSRIDGRPAEEWLRDDRTDSQREACVLNLLAKLRCVPSPDNAFITHIEHIVGVQLDRMYVRVAADLVGADNLLMQGDAFDDRKTPASDIHKLLVRWIGTRLTPPQLSPCSLTSFRQSVERDSMQVVVAKPSDPGAGCFADLDIDLGDPLAGLVGFAIHIFGELGDDAAVTDHLDLHDALVGDPSLKEFVYYDLDSGEVAPG